MTPTTPGQSAADPLLEDPDARFGPDGQPLDPREIARASLEAGRNASLWTVAGAVLACVAAALVWGPALGATLFAALLAVCAVVRAVVRGPGPAVLVVRKRAVDVLVLSVLALGIGALAQILP
ncbi:DUF3017 domain-containing protein [Cellulomonas denverensis]|uniref:DUF3017 domain-containing protein n=1 Tax=Cellulomonas denverensis TaxID=264297 RepID=A0A7X6R0S0_9CELL|nr:DUF3017 domain-containing protein [Cellulomonas denverensis]NKY24533.1 DUF3017 domain-containing protein [Cellulomonas denverensis]GIG26281.1 hypothetical protein Cde04nite_25250 [Cellulomonas denverensis]